MTIALKLTHDEPRLVYLALVYHLGRPGSELDPVSKQPSKHGLRDVERALANDVDAESAIIEVDEERYRKLLSAIYGCVNELRVFHMRSGAMSSVADFSETARKLFPAISADPEAALALSESMMMLHRRLERAVARSLPASSTTEAPRRRWPFRR